MHYSSFVGIAGGASVSLIPSVCRIVRAFPIWQVSLPFSRSMTNRSPVPDVSARSFCVTPSLFRVSLMTLPISFGVCFMGSPWMLPFGNIKVSYGKSQCIITVREYLLVSLTIARQYYRPVTQNRNQGISTRLFAVLVALDRRRRDRVSFA